MAPLDVVMPVAPGEREVARARDALESLVAYEEVGTIVVVDDDPRDRDLAHRAIPETARARAVALRNPRGSRGEGLYDGSTAGTLAGLRMLAERESGRMVLRLDSDALVIGPFAHKVVLEDGVAIAGSYEHAPMRTPRDFTPWAPAVRRVGRPFWLQARAPRVRRAPAGARAALRAANANGYRPGEHCLAAACVISPEFVRRAHAAGYLAPLGWLGTWLTDDVVLGIQVRALGMTMKGMTDPGDPFGVAQAKLPAGPKWLVEHGYSLIHPVKGEDDEDEVRAFFRARRQRQMPSTPPK